jgi:hypothetical protein
VEGSCERSNELSGSIKHWEVVRVAAQLAASQEQLSSMSDTYSIMDLYVLINIAFQNRKTLRVL